MRLEEYNGAGERLAVACDYYLDLAASLRDSDGGRAIWPCPACGNASFEASFEMGTAGCTEERCVVPSSMNLLELMVFLDEELVAGDERGAAKKFRGILEEAVRREQGREAELKEARSRAREERYWRKGLARARAREAGNGGWPEQRLF